MVMARWDPFQEARRMQSMMDRIWRSGLGESDSGMEAWSVPLDVMETDDSVVVRAEIPGVDPNQIDITVEDNILIISAERKEEREQQEGRYLMRETSQGVCRRALRLPNVIDAERAQSSYENGVLTVTFPKQERSRARRIQVQAGTGGTQLPGETQQQPAGEERRAA